VQRAGRRRSRLLGTLLVLLALAGAIIAIVVVTAPSEAKKEFRKVVSSDVQQIAVELRQLVSENTK
jgi:ABC-type Na+ efflux pump permease subunit